MLIFEPHGHADLCRATLVEPDLAVLVIHAEPS